MLGGREVRCPQGLPLVIYEIRIIILALPPSQHLVGLKADHEREALCSYRKPSRYKGINSPVLI